MNLQERDKQVIWHPFTQQKNMLPPIPIIKGQASLLFDDKGNHYIDAISSWWVNLHGHAHPYIAEQLYKQALKLEQVIFAGFTHEPAVELAENLLPILPGDFDKVFYSDNGSTAVEVAIKMALQYWWNKQLTVDSEQLAVKKNKILAFNNSYHGDTFGGMSVSDRSVFTKAFKDLLFDVIFIDTPTQQNISDVKAIIHTHQTEIAAFIYEPLVQGAGGICMYDADLLNEILNTAKQLDIICIADEVMTGFGRTGKFFAGEYMNEKADIICLSKGLTGGTMALGVTACIKKIYDAFVSDDKLKTFFHGHSFTANPLACTAALASLDLLLKPETISQIEFITKQNLQFKIKIEQHKTSAQIKNLRCLGTILAFEIMEGEDGYLNNISATITQKALQQGIYLRPLGNTVYIMPPYCITEKELNAVYGLLESLIASSI